MSRPVARPVQALRQPVVAWGDSIITDQLAPFAQSRASAFYRAPQAQPRVAWGQSIITDQVAPIITSRGVANYRGSFSLNSNAADEEILDNVWANLFQSRTQPNYTAPRALVTPPSDTSAVALDTWAQTTFGRATPYYTGSRAVTISVWDPATNTFADWTPAALLSRAVKAYSPPAAQPRVAWGDSVITDQFAPLSLSRMVGLYRAPLARITNVFDPALNTFADWTPAALISRSVARYRAPLSLTIPVFPDQVFGSEPALAALSRASAYYRAPRAFITPVSLNSAFGSDYAATVLSRRVTAYRGSYSLNISAVDEFIPGLFVPPTQSRQRANYAAPRARVTPVLFSVPIVYGTDWASVYQNARHLRVARKSLVIFPVGDLATIIVEPPIVITPEPPDLSGGGGFGAQMGGAWLDRYRPAYDGRYRGGYKSTLRRKAK